MAVRFRPSVEIPTMILRGYPVSGDPGTAGNPGVDASGFQAIYEWNHAKGERSYVVGHVSDHISQGYRDLSAMLPIEMEYRITLFGRGMHLAVWTSHKDWDSATFPSEVDLLEYAITGSDPSAGIVVAVSTHRPGGGSSAVSNDFMPQADRIGKWHSLKLDWDGNDLVWYINGFQVRREADTKSLWTDIPQIFQISWEIGGNWPGLPLTEEPGGQPADPTTDTPWPCEAQFRNMSFAGVPVDLAGAGGQIINSNDYLARHIANGNTKPTVSERWAASFPPYYGDADGPVMGWLRLTTNNDKGVACDNNWTGHADAPGGMGTLTVQEMLVAEGWE